MAEYIERESVYNTLKAMYCDECTDEKCQMCEYAEIMFVLDNLPIADVQPTARKPIKITEDEFWVQGYLVNEKYYCCPNCDKVLGNLRVHNVHELINEYKFCSECGQGLDWGNIKE